MLDGNPFLTVDCRIKSDNDRLTIILVITRLDRVIQSFVFKVPWIAVSGTAMTKLVLQKKTCNTEDLSWKWVKYLQNRLIQPPKAPFYPQAHLTPTSFLAIIKLGDWPERR